MKKTGTEAHPGFWLMSLESVWAEAFRQLEPGASFGGRRALGSQRRDPRDSSPGRHRGEARNAARIFRSRASPRGRAVPPARHLRLTLKKRPP